MACGEKPDFSHLCLHDKNCSGWQRFMEGHSTELEDVLWKSGADKNSWGVCLICGVEYPANLKSHIWGKAHCGKLKERLNWLEPSLEDLERHTQRWALAPGALGTSYWFNHVTGKQGFCDDSAAFQHNDSNVVTTAANPASPVQGVGDGVVSNAASSMAAGSDLGSMFVPHGQNFDQALNGTKDTWKAFVAEPAKRLEEYLSKATGHWDHTCVVCGKAMTRGSEDHIKSLGHWQNLWKKMQAMHKSLPPRNIAEDMGQPRRPWVQVFVVPAGEYAFNHLTGGQQLVPRGEGAGRPAAAAPPPCPPVAPPAPAAHPAALPPPQSSLPAALRNVQLATLPSEGVKSPNGRGRCAPAFEDARIVDPRLPVRSGVGYRDAMREKTDWVKFMDEPTKQFEAFIYKHFPSYSNPCPVCNAGMNGIREHLLSQKHWKSLWNRLCGDIPLANDAVDWDREWVQRFEVLGGTYLYNHVTGAQGMEGEVRAVEQQNLAVSRVAPASTETTRPILFEVVPANTAPKLFDLADSRNLGRRAAPATISAAPVWGPFENWHWRALVMRPAAALAAALRLGASLWGEQAAPSVWRCCMCDKTFLDVEEHLASEGHYTQLRSKLEQFAASQRYQMDDNILDQLGKQWIQEFDSGVSFNHVTLQTFSAPPAVRRDVPPASSGGGGGAPPPPHGAPPQGAAIVV